MLRAAGGTCFSGLPLSKRHLRPGGVHRPVGACRIQELRGVHECGKAELKGRRNRLYPLHRQQQFLLQLYQRLDQQVYFSQQYAPLSFANKPSYGRTVCVGRPAQYWRTLRSHANGLVPQFRSGLAGTTGEIRRPFLPYVALLSIKLRRRFPGQKYPAVADSFYQARPSATRMQIQLNWLRKVRRLRRLWREKREKRP